MSKLTSVSKVLSEIKSEVEQNRKALVNDLKKSSKKNWQNFLTIYRKKKK
jgi:hypothetical protein